MNYMALFIFLLIIAGALAFIASLFYSLRKQKKILTGIQKFLGREVYKLVEYGDYRMVQKKDTLNVYVTDYKTFCTLLSYKEALMCLEDPSLMFYFDPFVRGQAR